MTHLTRSAMLVAAWSLATISFAQDVDERQQLAVGTTIEGSLAADQGQSFVIEADADTFVRGAAVQVGVDVVVRVFRPDGSLLREFDGPAEGPEAFHFETKTSGEFRIEVAPFEGATGAFAITLTTLEPIAKTGPERADQLMAPFTGSDVPGGVVVVVQDGKVVFRKGYGAASLEHAAPFTTATPSNLGSTSKQFTAFAIAMLDASGELSFDDDVRKHIPELPDLGEVVTLRHLLSHTSGYREFLNTLIMTGRRMDAGDHIDRDEIIPIVQRQPRLQNSPGAEWNYNNTGYGLLSMVVERVSGISFPEWMDQNVFQPLDMTNTVVRSSRFQIVPGRSIGYVPGPNGFREAVDLGGSMGAGGIYSTADDMAKWTSNLLDMQVGTGAIYDAMTTPYLLTAGEQIGRSTSYGMGLFVDEQGSLQRVQHGGADMAHRTMLMVFPEIEAGIVVMSNHAGFDSTSIADSLAATFFSDSMTFVEKPKPVVAEAVEAGTFDVQDFDPKSFDAFVGRYELDAAPGFILTFSREGDTLHTQATGQPRLTIIPVGPRSFTIDGVDAKVVFDIDENGNASCLTLHQGGEHKAHRVEEEAWAPTPEDLAAYAGRYYSEELETFYELAVEGEDLVLKHRRLNDAMLVPAEQHQFTAPSSISKLDFETDDEGAVTGFRASNGRARDILFVLQR